MCALTWHTRNQGCTCWLARQHLHARSGDTPRQTFAPKRENSAGVTWCCVMIEVCPLEETNMSVTKSIRRSVSTTPEMRDRLAQLVSKHPRDISEADLIREAIRADLDEQTDLIGISRHFQKSLQDRIDRPSTQPIGIAHSRSWKSDTFLRIGCSLISARAKKHGLRIASSVCSARIRRAPVSAKRIGRCVRRAKRLSMRCVR